MFKLSALAVLVAASLFAAVVSRRIHPEPELSDYEDLPSLQIVIGDNVEGAGILESVAVNKASCRKRSCNFTENFVFPSSSSLSGVITKIVILVERTHDKQTAEAEVVAGGIKKNNVELQIKVKNSKKLNYRVVVFGTA